MLKVARPMGRPRPSRGVAGDTLAASLARRLCPVLRLWLAGGSLAESAANRAGPALEAVLRFGTSTLARPLGVSGCLWVDSPLTGGLHWTDSRLRGVAGPLPDLGVPTPPGPFCLRLFDGVPELPDEKSSLREVLLELPHASLLGARRILWEDMSPSEHVARPSTGCATIFVDGLPPVRASIVPTGVRKQSDSILTGWL